jgi:hypothetical protein
MNSQMKYTVDDFCALKKRGDYDFYFNNLMKIRNILEHRQSCKQEDSEVETNLSHLPIEIINHIADIANDSIKVYFIRFSSYGEIVITPEDYETCKSAESYTLKACMVYSLKAKSSLYAVGQITSTPPAKIQGVCIRRNNLKYEENRSTFKIDDKNSKLETICDLQYFDYFTSNFKFHSKDFVLMITESRPFFDILFKTEEDRRKNLKRVLEYFANIKQIKQLAIH